MKLCILISAFCLLTSVGFGLDVSVDTILAPSGTVDSGQSVIPRMVVSNRSNEPADSVNACFMIDDGSGGYEDSLTALHLDALATETLAFHGWTPRGRDSMEAIAWTECDGDTFPANDTSRLRFLVRVKDIAITQITVPQPDTTVDSGVVFYPQCRVWNYGNVSLNFDVWFSIGSFHSTRNLSLIAGGATLVTAPDLYTATTGIWGCGVGAIVVGDLHPENNFKGDTFTVRGTISESVWARVMMSDTVYMGDTITPQARAGYRGGSEASFWLSFSMSDSAGPELYAESSQVILSPGDSMDLDFPTMCFAEPGAYLAVARAWIDSEHVAADSRYFWVVPRPGIEESPKPQASSPKPRPTVVRGILFLPQSLLTANSSLLSADGRRVLALVPGANDVTRLAAGVYFVRAESMAAGRGLPAVHKVVIQH